MGCGMGGGGVGGWGAGWVGAAWVGGTSGMGAARAPGPRPMRAGRAARLAGVLLAGGRGHRAHLRLGSDCRRVGALCSSASSLRRCAAG